MSLRFAATLAAREARSTARRLGAYMSAIALGVAALVALNSFRAGVVRSTAEEARVVLGADLRLTGNTPPPTHILAALDSAAGDDVASVVSVASMVRAPKRARLMQVQAVDGGYPFYGVVRTDPANAWGRTPRGAALVESAVLTQLGAAVGDTLAIGETRLVIAAAVTEVPGDVDFRSLVAPRVFISADDMRGAGLLAYGSIARYQTYARIPDRARLGALLESYTQQFQAARLDYDSAEEQREDMADAFGALGRFLGLIGVIALLLGGIGVASGINVFVKDKIQPAAVLRCIGARERDVFGAYVLQAAGLAFAGSLAGVALGLGLQALLPRITAGLLPIDVGFRIEWLAILGGVAAGFLIAIVFALIPLLALRRVSPLQALRSGFEAQPSGRVARMVVALPLALGILAVCVWQAPTPMVGIVFAAALVVVTGLLGLIAWALLGASRRMVPARTAFVARQALANLHRPRNQTMAVTLALGFAAFLIAALYVVQHNVSERFRFDSASAAANLLLFDVQPDQLAGVMEIAVAQGAPLEQASPVVPARLDAINGVAVASLLGDTVSDGPEFWALRREYRHTYRDTLAASEELLAGRWWNEPFSGAPVPRISIELGLSESLQVGVGDRLTWDIGGIPVESEIMSVRSVDWARFEPNFFVVFEPGVLEAAPQSFLALARLDDATERAAFQNEVAERYANVSVLDLTQVQRAVEAVSGKVRAAVRFLGSFAIAGGLLVLAGALGASRRQRLREAALLRTLGASARQIRGISAGELLALGGIAGLTGILLGGLAGWLVVVDVFEIPFVLPVRALLALQVALMAISLVVGWAGVRRAGTRPPLEVLRAVD